MQVAVKRVVHIIAYYAFSIAFVRRDRRKRGDVPVDSKGLSPIAAERASEHTYTILPSLFFSFTGWEEVFDRKQVHTR